MKTIGLLILAAIFAIWLAGQREREAATVADAGEAQFEQWKADQRAAERRAGPAAMAEDARLAKAVSDCARTFQRYPALIERECRKAFDQRNAYRVKLGLSPVADE